MPKIFIDDLDDFKEFPIFDVSYDSLTLRAKFLVVELIVLIIAFESCCVGYLNGPRYYSNQQNFSPLLMMSLLSNQIHTGKAINDLLHLRATPLDLLLQVLHLALAEFEFIGDVWILREFLAVDDFEIALFEEAVMDFTQSEQRFPSPIEFLLKILHCKPIKIINNKLALALLRLTGLNLLKKSSMVSNIHLPRILNVLRSQSYE
jgi:hypothetical protein